jgi:hypothetical protein
MATGAAAMAAAISIPQKTLIVSLLEYRAVHTVLFAAKPIAANWRPSNGTCARRIQAPQIALSPRGVKPGGFGIACPA